MLVPIAAEELERRATIRPPSALLVPLIWCPFRACFSGGWIPGLKPHKTLALLLRHTTGCKIVLVLRRRPRGRAQLVVEANCEIEEG
jgi:hypothetical protein